MMHEFLEQLRKEGGLAPSLNAEGYSPLVLAYIGDAVLELYVRTFLTAKGNAPVNRLHVRASHIVCAAAQSAMVDKVWDCLSDEEIAVFKRGRNAKSYTSAKNASIADYRRSTGFEALLGYLYLSRAYSRIFYILDQCMPAEEEAL